MNKYTKIFSALSDNTRLHIYLLLLKEDLCVCELVKILNMEQSRISHGLRNMKEAGLVNARREGKWIIYSANREMLKSKIIQGLKSELVIKKIYLKQLDKCKSEKIKEKCSLKQKT